MSAFRFRPGLASTALTILLFPFLVSLGVWQLGRAADKEALAAILRANHDAPTLRMTGNAPLREAMLRGRAARAEGRYIAPTLLLDNRARRGRNGYEVLTPYQLPDGSRMLVARGWVPADPDRTHAPGVETPSDPRNLQGRLGKAPVTGIRLGNPPPPERLADDLVRVQSLAPDTVEAALGFAVPPEIFYLDPALPNGYDRDWPAPASDIGKHHAYAVQWFAMAGVLLILYVRINLRRDPS
ncbi:MAG: SURF1 family protein [Gammaproteobacteria bacterium]